MAEQIVKKILSLVLAVVFVAFIVGVSLWETDKDNAYKNAQSEYQGRTKGYQTARESLQEELAELKKEPVYYGDNANIMVGFAVSNASDIDYIRKKAELYDFAPVLIVDSTQTAESIMSMIETADEEWEIMLFSQLLSSSTGDKLAAVRDELEANGKNVCNAVFTRIQGISNSDIAMLQSAGFNGFTLYHDQPISGQDENGSVFFDFSRITSGNKYINSRMSACLDQRSSMIYFFDMSSIRSGSISDEQLDKYLTTISEYAEKDGCSYATVAETLEMLLSINQVKADIMASRTDQIAALEARIAVLDQIISDIYIDCFGEK